jgi:hypothetical protein
VFENGALRRIFEPRRDEVKGEWRKLHIEELNDLYFSPHYCSGDKIEKNEMGEASSAYGREERLIQGFGVET